MDDTCAGDVEFCLSFLPVTKLFTNTEHLQEQIWSRYVNRVYLLLTCIVKSVAVLKEISLMSLLCGMQLLGDNGETWMLHC